MVLASPRNPLNIGAVARAMANFGFAHLTVVAAYEPHWREAKSAVGAEQLLQSARVTETLQEALAEASFVLGTATLTHREPEQAVVALPELAPMLGEELARHKSARVAIVFGPEKRGLTRDDLALCHRLLTIPTRSAQPSMNLAQAVAVCLYEISTALNGFERAGGQDTDRGERSITSASEASATVAELDQLAVVIDETMQAANYSPATMRAANRHDTDLLLRRLALSGRDARRILGLFRRILFRLRKS